MALVVVGVVLPSAPFTSKLAAAWFFGVPKSGSSLWPMAQPPFVQGCWTMATGPMARKRALR